MLSLVLIYWIGKSFHTIAESSGRSPWLWAIAGVVFYYGFQIIVGIAILLMWYSDDILMVDSGTERGVGLMGAIVSGIVTYFLYQFLKKKWETSKLGSENSMLDDDVINNKF